MDKQHSSKDNNDKHVNKINKNVVSAKRHQVHATYIM